MIGAPAPGLPPGGAPLYRLRGSLDWRELDGEWVVCAQPSCSLFQLDALGAAVLGLLEAGPQHRQGLLASLAEATGTAEADAAGTSALGQALEATLARLVADDLVIAPVRP